MAEQKIEFPTYFTINKDKIFLPVDVLTNIFSYFYDNDKALCDLKYVNKEFYNGIINGYEVLNKNKTNLISHIIIRAYTPNYGYFTYHDFGIYAYNILLNLPNKNNALYYYDTLDCCTIQTNIIPLYISDQSYYYLCFDCNNIVNKNTTNNICDNHNDINIYLSERSDIINYCDKCNIPYVRYVIINIPNENEDYIEMHNAKYLAKLKCQYHCCECNINTLDNEKHCCKCKIIYESKRFHCCNCKIIYTSEHFHCCNCKVNYKYKLHCCKCRMDYDEMKTHCCKCKINYDTNNESHCCKCKINYDTNNESHCYKCRMVYNNNKSHCCNCKKTYYNNESHCCKCEMVYYNNESHCCKCKINYDTNNESHCCKCEMGYNNNESHCCKCKMNYDSKKLHCCKCEMNYDSKKLHCCNCKEIYISKHICKKKKCEECDILYIDLHICPYNLFVN